VASDPRHCGSCGNDCVAKAVHALVACIAGACVTTGCESGYHDLDDDGACEYGCVASGPEQCDGLDNDCDGLVDEGVVPPSPTKACGVSLAATRPECTSAVTVSCVAGSWSCSFPAGVCVGGRGVRRARQRLRRPRERERAGVRPRVRERRR
jgi:hypothetical protein